MRHASSATALANRIAAQFDAIAEGWETYGAPVEKRAADACAASLNSYFRQFEFQVFPHGAHWIVKRRARA